MTNKPKAWKSFWTRPMEHLADVADVKSRFSTFRDSVRVRAI
jgi:hypothetical protein